MAASFGETDIPFHIFHNCEDQFMISAVRSAERPSYYLRDERHPLEKVTHAGGKIRRHPEHPDILYKAAAAHTLCNDTPVRITNRWLEGQFSEAQIKIAVDYFKQEMPEASVSYDMQERIIDINSSFVFGRNQKEFVPTRPEYNLLGHSSRIDLSVNAKFICIIRMADNYQEWKTDWRDLMAGETCQLKRNSENCYFVFSNNVIKDGAELEEFKPYRLSRDNVDITCTENTKIFRVSV